MGKKELKNSKQSIRYGHGRYLFLFKRELIKNKNIEDKKIKHK